MMRHSTHTPARNRSGSSHQLILFVLVQVLLIASGIAYGAYRVLTIEHERQLPIPRTDPIRVDPIHNRPDMVSDVQLQSVLERLKPRLRGPNPKINDVDHALRFWGVEAVFDDPECLSGIEMRDLLLDHRSFSKAWGPKTKPFLIPDTRDEAFTFRTQSGKATASHVDHTLAGLAEVGTTLDFPVITPKGESPLSTAFTESLKRFSLNQEEYEWSTLAYLLYMPDVSTWFTSEGQQVTWDRLSERIMRQRLNDGVCFGNHRMHALVMLLRIDADFHLLSSEGRSRIVDHVKAVSARLVTTQHADGYWDEGWSGDEWDGPVTRRTGSLGPQADRLLATGHLLEWCALAPADLLPPEQTLTRAAQWICHEIQGLSPTQVKSYYPFLTHAGRALALWRGRLPAESLHVASPEER